MLEMRGRTTTNGAQGMRPRLWFLAAGMPGATYRRWGGQDAGGIASDPQNKLAIRPINLYTERRSLPKGVSSLPLSYLLLYIHEMFLIENLLDKMTTTV